MGALSTGALTLLDWAKRLDPDGKTAAIVELLSQSNEILDDMTFIEGNLPTGHRTSVRTGLPTVAWRLLNAGVATSKSTAAQIDEQCGMLEAWCEVDCDLASLNGNTGAFRLSEAKAFIEAMNQEVAGTLFYGNAGLAQEEFTGLAPRYSAISGATNGSHIVLGGNGSGSDQMSIWLIVWGDNTVTGIFPKGSKAGLSHQDYGEVTAEVTAGVGGTRMRVYQERWQWKIGIALKDWRFAVRGQVDLSNLTGNSNPADIPDVMIKMIHRVPSLKVGRPAFYMNRTTRQYLDLQARNDVISGGQLSYDVVGGKPITRFRGIPVRICDQLTEAEDLIS